MLDTFRTPTAKLAVVLAFAVVVAVVVLTLASLVVAARAWTSPLANSAWQLTQIGEASPPPGAAVTLTFERSPSSAVSGALVVGGHSGVNTYFGTATLGRNRSVVVRDIGATEMAGPPELMDLEQRFLAALGAVERYDITTRTGVRELVLYADGAPVLKFSARTPKD